MRKASVIMSLLAVCTCLCASGLSFDAAQQSFCFNAGYISYNSATGYMKARFGPVEAGSLAGNWHVFSLFDSYSYAWKEHYREESGAVEGLALDFEEASFFMIRHPSLALGASVRILGIEFAAAQVWRGEKDDGLFVVHSERSGWQSSVMKLGYSNEYVMARVKLSYGEDAGLDVLASGGLSWKGFGVIYTRGAESDVLALERQSREALRVFLDSGRLYFTFSHVRYGTPVRPGTYREVEGRFEAQLDICDEVAFTSQMKSFFHSDGRWTGEVGFGVRLWGAQAAWSSVDGLSLSYDFGRLTVFMEGDVYGVRYEVEGPWYRMKVGIRSSGSLETAFSFEFP